MTTQSKIIRVGDKVRFRGAFGAAAPATATVEEIDNTGTERSKYGDPVNEIDIAVNQGVFGLSSGSWCYADQIDAVPGRWSR